MFKETDNGQTQYCPMCLEWAEKYEKLKAENERLKEDIEKRKQWRVNSIYTIKKLSDNAKAYIRAFNCSNREINELRMKNEELKKRNEELDKMTGIYSYKLMEKYKQVIKEAREYAKLKYLSTKNVDLFVVQDLLNEVLKDE